MQTEKRQPKDDDERGLITYGWRMVGLTLFEHPQLNGYFAKEKALKEHMGYYCPACGACGYPECCAPQNTCMCFFGDEYKRDYKELLEENDKYYKFIERVSNTADIDLDELPWSAKQVLGD